MRKMSLLAPKTHRRLTGNISGYNIVDHPFYLFIPTFSLCPHLELLFMSPKLCSNIPSVETAHPLAMLFAAAAEHCLNGSLLLANHLILFGRLGKAN